MECVESALCVGRVYVVCPVRVVCVVCAACVHCGDCGCMVGQCV